jgi:hypothetical protein
VVAEDVVSPDEPEDSQSSSAYEAEIVDEVEVVDDQPSREHE